MKYLKYILTIAVVSIILIFLTIKLYFHYDLPTYSGTHELSYLQDTVAVYTDQYGVPHIFAKNNEDLFFSAGYIIARERLFQLSVLAAVSRGETSAILGDTYVDHDKFIKENKIFSENRIDISIIQVENRMLLDHFCSGINSFIEESEKTLPISFKITKSKPIKWTALDAVNVLTMMTNNIKQDRQIGMFINTIEQYFGENKLNELLTAEEYNRYKLGGGQNKYDIKLENQIWDLIGATDGILLSNTALIQPESTTKPILVFEDIWGLKQPAKWFDIHLFGGEYNFEGSILPGFPVPLAGKTDEVAWAVNGKITENTINSLFEISKVGLNKNNLSDMSIIYADTTGFYSNNREIITIIDSSQNHTEYFDGTELNRLMNSPYNKNFNTTEIGKNIFIMYLDNSSVDQESALTSMNRDVLLNVIYLKFLENIFTDEFMLIGDDFFDTFICLSDLAEQSIVRILNNSESSWIDDIRTADYRENLTEIIKKSVEDALDETNTFYQVPNTKGKNGTVKNETIKHILYERAIFAKIFNLNVDHVNVSNLNISPGDNRIDSSNKQNSVISLRRIFDLSDMSSSYSILPTGQSGLPRSLHYSDQRELFNKNKLRKIEFNESAVRNSDQYKKLVLCPVE